MQSNSLHTITRLSPTLIVLIPLVRYWNSFCELFWFGDELQLLKEISTFGFWQSTILPFAEGIVPFYKIFWGSIAIAGHTHYLPMVLILWFIHLFNVAVFITLLTKAGFSRFTSTYAPLVAGLAWSNIDLLTISYHLNSGLCTFFYLCALKILIDATHYHQVKYGWIFGYFCLLLLSILTFQRALVSIASLLVFAAASTIPNKKAVLGTTLIALFIQIALLVFSQQGAITSIPVNQENLSSAIRYGTSFFAYNPLLHLFIRSPHLIQSGSLFWPFFLGKCAIFGLGIMVSLRSPPALLATSLTLFSFDILHSAVLGMSRFSQGIESVSVYRYQFSSLIVFAPFMALALENFSNRICTSKRALQFLLLTMLTVSLFLIYRPWGKHIRAHAYWQGRQSKRILLPEQYSGVVKGNSLKDQDWNGVPPTMTREEARATLRSML